MPRYRSKPSTVDAIVWDGTNNEAVVHFVRRYQPFGAEDDGCRFASATELRLWVAKGQSQCTIYPGDAIVGESDAVGVYPCVAAVFADRYEPIAEEAP